jgi:hypothetical protein
LFFNGANDCCRNFVATKITKKAVSANAFLACLSAGRRTGFCSANKTEPKAGNSLPGTNLSLYYPAWPACRQASIFNAFTSALPNMFCFIFVRIPKRRQSVLVKTSYHKTIRCKKRAKAWQKTGPGSFACGRKVFLP